MMNKDIFLMALYPKIKAVPENIRKEISLQEN
jgi:hypothetical protein